MLVLNTTTKIIRLKLDVAGTVPYVVDYIDFNDTTFTPGSLDGYSNGTTAVTIVTAPASGKSRRIKGITIYNSTSGDISPTIYENNNGSVYNIVNPTLKTLETLQYTDGKGWNIIDTDGWIKVGGDAVKYNWKRTGWINYVTTKLQPHLQRQRTKGGGSIVVNRFTTGYTIPDYSYRSGVLAQNDCIYLMPGSINSTTWHYINTKTKAYGTYTGIESSVVNKYIGGVLDRNGIIWPIPYNQANQSTYHYIDTNNNTVTEFSHGLGADTPVQYGYIGGLLTPDGSRIYLCPYNQSNQSKWHYIDTTTKTYVAYSHGLGADTPVQYGYFSGVLAPNGKIYLIPTQQAYELKWHYIDTNTNTVVSYENGLNHAAGRSATNEYRGGVLTPDNKIYFIPYGRSSESTWAYIDATTGTCYTYEHGIGTIISGAYNCCCISVDGKVFPAPFAQADQTTWHYLNTSNNTWYSYTPTYTAAYQGFYHAVLDRFGNIWLIGSAASTTYQYYITNSPKGWCPLSICTSPLYNKQ